MRRRLATIFCLLMLPLGYVWAATPTPVETVVAPMGVYSVGEYTILPVAIPAEYTKGYIKIDRTQWLNPASHINWLITLSQDGGETWTDLSGASAVGGIIINPLTGQPRTEATIWAPLAQPENANRQIRATIVVSGAAAEVRILAGIE
jgi:hypothetical protein